MFPYWGDMEPLAAANAYRYIMMLITLFIPLPIQANMNSLRPSDTMIW